MTERPAPMLEEHRRATRASGPSRWLTSILLVGLFIGAMLHFTEFEQFAQLIEEAQPGWLILILGLQLATYASVACGWSATLRRNGAPQPLSRLIRIAVIKLFADQAIPSAGMGGNVLLVDRLHALGVPRGAAVAALLVSMIGFYAAFAILALLMLLLLWQNGAASPLIAGTVTLFLAVAFAIPALALWLRRRGRRPLPPALAKIGVVRTFMQSVGEAPPESLRDRPLILKVAGFNALVFLADAATLWASVRAVGQALPFATAFIALVMASIVVTLGPVPLGLGSFEATSTAMLHHLGVPLAAALAGTMLTRLFTLWLPLLPGLILLRSQRSG
ncbi:lysylphosphatidylglycerol synthase transmembrane domain-containing protein [Sphingobium yanoikuyae]|uniref:lysylphosphatidylglycerol synthase transmembrane domain-containing protein n=1 Tax=Sphingobium yanoikuyae TaxID=13690 RepID=UPI00241DDDA6|nr:lysylphosphatidylglycerol synthase transmembrane domain-containing protein [Sphingobium yanoikuyae]